jgi:hypothetical protein
MMNFRRASKLLILFCKIIVWCPHQITEKVDLSEGIDLVALRIVENSKVDHTRNVTLFSLVVSEQYFLNCIGLIASNGRMIASYQF